MKDVMTKSLDEAMNDLEKANDTEEIEDEETEDEELEDDDTAEEEEVDTEKAMNFDLNKAEDVEEMEEYLRVDNFLKGMVETVDANTVKLEKAIGVLLGATRASMTVQKGMSDKIEALETLVKGISDTPNPQKSALTPGAAKNLEKAIQPRQFSAPGELTKSEAEIRKAISSELTKGVQANELDAMEVVAFQNTRDFPLTDAVGMLSEKARTRIASILDAAQNQ